MRSKSMICMSTVGLLPVLLVTNMAFANEAKIGFQVAAGNFNTGKETHGFTAAEFGEVVGENSNESLSIAARAVFRQPSGVELGIGVRAGDNRYKASYGSAASAVVSANSAAIKDAQDAIAALDKDSATYEADLAAQEEIINSRTADNARIAQAHVASKAAVGVSASALRFMPVGSGELGLGAEVFVNSKVAPAFKVAYRDRLHAGANFGVEALSGKGWTGAGLTVDF